VTASTRPRLKGRRLPEERPQQIIAAAIEVFGRHGLSSGRLEDIAKRAGLSKGTIYLYFPNKEALFKEMIHQTIIARLEMTERELDERGGSATQQVTDCMRLWWRNLLSPDYQVVYRLILSELQHFPDLARFYSREFVARQLGLVSRLIQRGIDSGDFREIDPTVAARVMGSMLTAHAVWHAMRRCGTTLVRRSADETLEQLTDFFLTAMRPRVTSVHRSSASAPRRARTALIAALAVGALGGAAGLSRAARAQVASDSTVRATDTTARPLTLGDAARLAAHQSAQAQEAQARTTQAGARVRQQFAEFLPNLSGSASVMEYDLNSAAAFRFPSVPGSSFFNTILPPAGALFPPLKDYDARARIADTLFSFGAIQRYRQSQTSRDAATADAANTAELAAAAAANAYLQVQRAEATVRARIADSALAEDLLHIAIQQLAAGVGVQLDVTRAQAQRSSAHAQLITARNQLDQTRLNLFRSLGLPLDTRLTLVDSLGGLPVADSLSPESQALDRAFRDRPDLRAADLQLEAARRQVSAIRAERLPALGAFATDGASAGTLNRVLNTYSWGVGVSLPVFDGFRREGRIEEGRAGEHEIELRRRDLRQQAAIEVRGAYLDLGSARQQVDATREQRELTDEEVTEARERFRTGVAGNADVITAELALDAARTQEIDALTNYQSARVALARATGSVTSLP